MKSARTDITSAAYKAYKAQTLDVNSERGKFGFYLTLAYMLIEYGRPMDLLPFIGYIRPAAIITVLMLITSLNSLDIRKIKKPQIILFGLFILLSACFVPFAHHRGFAYRTTLSMALYFVFAVSVLLHVNTIKRLKIFISLWIVLTTYIAVRGIAHGSSEGIGGSSFLYDENDFSLFLDTMLPFSVYMFMCETKKLKKIFYLISSMLLLAGIVISFSRGGFVGLLAASLVILMFSEKKVIALALIGIFATFVYLYGETFSVGGVNYLNEISSITDTHESTASMRIDAWTSAWHMFLDNPIGVGPGNFPVRYPEYQLPSATRNMWGFVAHSLWFTLIPEMGVFGIIIYAVWLYYNLKDIFWLRRLKDQSDPGLRLIFFLSMAYLAGLAGFFASASFLAALYYPHYFYLTAIIVATKGIANRTLNYVDQ